MIGQLKVRIGPCKRGDQPSEDMYAVQPKTFSEPYEELPVPWVRKTS
jgi:hypothetical protein